MKLIFLALFAACALCSAMPVMHPTHDFKLGAIQLANVDGQVKGSYRADRLELLDEMGLDLSEKNIQRYLDSHMSVEFDKQVAQLVFEKYDLQKDFITLHFLAEGINASPTTVAVKASFLVNQVDGHSNRVILRLNESVRSFLLDKDDQDMYAKY